MLATTPDPDHDRPDDQRTHRPDAADAGFDPAAVLRFLWQRKLLVLGTAGAVFAAAVVYLNVAVYRYSAALVVTPAQGGSAGSLPGGLGALASFAGADLTRSLGGSAYPLYVATLKSRGVAERLAADPAMVRHIFAADWNSRERRWQHRPGIVERTLKPLRRLLGLPDYPWKQPGAAEVQIYLQRNLEVTDDTKRSLTTIKILDRDATFAARLVTRIHEAADAAIRTRTLKRTGEYIDYLERKLPTVTLAEQRDALVRSLSDQEKLRMQASATVEFAAEPLGPIEVSPRPVSPSPMLVLVLALLGGLGAGIGLALATTLFRRRRATGRGM